MNEKIRMTLEGFKEAIVEKFNGNIESIVLFGSYAQGREHRFSDIDLLIIARKLPDGWRAREKIAVDMKFDAETEYGKTLSIILASSREIKDSIKTVSPFYLSILDGYKIIFDRDGFFRKEMEMFRRKSNAVYNKKYKLWEVGA